MANDVFGVGLSGLMASQRGLATTGHNISNVNTDGYSRQRVELATRTPQRSEGGFIGTGVKVANVRRVYDSFLSDQIRISTANHSGLKALHTLASQVDNTLANPATGLSSAMEGFFNAIQDLNADPSSLPAREVVLSEAQGLAQRLHSLDQWLEDVRGGVNAAIGDVVTEVNSMADEVATLNERIILAQGTGVAEQANDLLDARDELIRAISERININTFQETNGAVNVTVGTGQPLVIANTATPLSVVASPFDPSRSEIAQTVGSGTTVISDLISGGEIAGILDFRRQVLDTTQNALGRVATGLAQSVNAQHQLGIDLSGAAGGDFFVPLDASGPRVLPNSQNTGTPAAQLGVSIADVSALVVSDYRLAYDGSTYTLTRLSDGTVTDLGNLPATPVVVDGVDISLAAGVLASGDQFLIQPTRLGARNFGLNVNDPAQIALTGAIRSEASVSNLGSATISQPSVNNANNTPLSGSGGDITMTFDPDALGIGVPGFAVTNGPGGVLPYDPATEGTGKTFTFPGFGGTTFTLAGTPLNGDTFVLSDNTNAVGDNRNGLLLAELQQDSILDQGNANFGGAYAEIVASVGTATRQAEISLEAQSTLLDQAVQSRDSVSGVNLDEEAANLLRYQQAYQANAQLIAVADSLFDSLLGAVAR